MPRQSQLGSGEPTPITSLNTVVTDNNNNNSTPPIVVGSSTRNTNNTNKRNHESSGGGGIYSPRSLNSQNNNNTRASSFATRQSGNRSTLRMSRMSDTGIEFNSEEPSATTFSTIIAIMACIIGAGILSTATSSIYMSFGLSMIVLTFFWLLSMFACYVLSVCCEYMGIYSQAQLLTSALCGGPVTIEQIAIVKRFKNKNNNKNTSSSAIDDDQNDNNNNNDNDDDDQQNNEQRNEEEEGEVWSDRDDDDENINKSGEKTTLIPKIASQGAITDVSVATNQSDEYIQAVLECNKHRNIVNLCVDVVNGLTFWLYLVTYSRALSDSMVSVSKDLGFPGFFTRREGWLLIAGAFYILMGMRRSFAELTISSIFGIISIMFVVVCIIVRYFDPFDIVHLPLHDYKPAASAGNDYFYFGSQFLSGFTVISSAFAYQVNHPPFYLELKQRSPATMQKSVVVATTLVYISYIIAAVFGIALFGAEVDSKAAGGNIVDMFSAKDTLINVARFMIMIHFISIVPITICTSRQHAHRIYLRLRGWDERAEDVDEVFKVGIQYVIIESLIVIITGLVVADTVPGIAFVIAICGCCGGALSIFVLPGLCGMAVFSEFEKRGFTGKGDDDAELDVVTNVEDTQHQSQPNMVSPTSPTVVRNKTPAAVSGNHKPEQFETGGAEDDKVPKILTSIYSNNLIGFCRFRLSNRTYYYFCAVMVVIGAASCVGGIISTFSNM